MCRYDGYDDSPEVYREEVRTARKKHKCNECGRDIKPGETYENHFYVYDGDPGTVKICAHCRIAKTWIKVNCGGWVFEQVREEIEEHAKEYPRLALPLLRIAVGMKRRWRRFVGDTLMPIPRIPPGIEVEVIDDLGLLG